MDHRIHSGRRDVRICRNIPSLIHAALAARKRVVACGVAIGRI
jgi:hypothetical protein